MIMHGSILPVTFELINYVHIIIFLFFLSSTHGDKVALNNSPTLGKRGGVMTGELNHA